eukprot:scaffold319513_cov38-Prasinocladus_malaysianus.AAC.1
MQTNFFHVKHELKIARLHGCDGAQCQIDWVTNRCQNLAVLCSSAFVIRWHYNCDKETACARKPAIKS